MNKNAKRLRRRQLVWMALALAMLSVRPWPAYSSDPPAEGFDPAVAETFGRLAEHMDDADWQEESQFIVQAMDNLWKRNGWTDEADRYARDLACELTAIPPWRVMKRLNTFNERLAQRYGLSEEEVLRFQGAIVRETGGVLMRNMGTVMGQFQEWMQTRAEGKPFTAEQVARWTKEGQPLIAEMRNVVDRLAKTLRPMLDPEKRQVLDRDMRSFDKRKKLYDEMAARWVQGEWQPEHWGLEDDPIHKGASAATKPKRARPSRVPPRAPQLRRDAKIPKCVAHDPATWYACVLELQERFKLDPGQVTTAESVRAELFERAKGYTDKHADTLKQVPPGERDTHAAYEPIRTLFHELTSRLDAIPTTSQRSRSGQ